MHQLFPHGTIFKLPVSGLGIKTASYLTKRKHTPQFSLLILHCGKQIELASNVDGSLQVQHFAKPK
jgi:hypothetical protein